MPEQPARSFTIQALVSHATWPGGRALCHRLTAPKWMPDMWLLQSGETGEISELRAYRYGMLRGVRR